MQQVEKLWCPGMQQVEKPRCPDMQRVEKPWCRGMQQVEKPRCPGMLPVSVTSAGCVGQQGRAQLQHIARLVGRVYHRDLPAAHLRLVCDSDQGHVLPHRGLSQPRHRGHISATVGICWRPDSAIACSSRHRTLAGDRPWVVVVVISSSFTWRPPQTGTSQHWTGCGLLSLVFMFLLTCPRQTQEFSSR
ncbi:hypothetical protein BsWGS_19993 [Bradybaena similaris]